MTEIKYTKKKCPRCSGSGRLMCGNECTTCYGKGLLPDLDKIK